jgi:hypothetical protein
VRHPTRPTWADRLPKGLFLPDSFLGYRKMKSRGLLLNDGLHMHGIMIVPKKNRLKYPLDVLIERDKDFSYGNKIQNIDIG